jgi:hypothetical protein
MNEAVRGNGYFKFKNKDGETNYAYINSASVDDDAIIQYTVNGRTEDELPYLSQVDDEGNVTKTGFKDAFMAGFVEASTEQEYVAKLMEMLKSMHTEVPVDLTENDYSSPNNYNQLLNFQDPIGFAVGSSNPLPSPEVEWDINPVVKQEQKRLNDDVSVLIQNKIDLLKEEQNNVQSNISDINKVVKSLSAQLTSKTKLSGIEVDRIQKQIQTLLNIVNSNSKKNSKKGLSTLGRSEDLKLNIRAEFKTLNELFDSIKELKKYAYQLRTIRKDLNNQINYYNSLLNDNLLSEITTQQLINRRNKISNKISIIDRLIKLLSDALSKSIRYIKSYVDSIKTSFKNLKSNDLKGLLNESLDTNLITNYNEVNNEFRKLESGLYAHLDNLDFLEENKKNEERRLDELNNKLTQLTNQFRYIDELINEIPIDNSPIPEIKLPDNIPSAPIQTEIIVPKEIPVIVQEQKKLEVIKSTPPVKAPVVEWDIEPIVNIETKPKPKNVSKKPKGNIAVDQEIEPVEDITIPPVEPTIIIEDEWEKNKLFTPSTTVSYLSRQYVKSTNGRVKNKNNTRTLKPIDTQEYLVGDPGYFRITDGNYDTHDVPIEIIIKGDKQNVNKAYVPTIASILATDGSIPGLFSEEDPTKSDAENKYMILNDRGLQVLAAIQAYVSDPNKANGNSYNKISTLIAAPFKNNKDKNPFTRMLTAKKEDKTVIRDFNMATDELINLYQNRSRVIADINAGIARPRTKIKSINSGRPARLVSNETETTPNTNLVRVSKFLKDTGVQVRQYESKKKGKFNVLSLPMKRSTLEDSVTMGVLVKVDKVDHDLVYAFIEDYLTKGPITRKLDSQAAMKLLNTVWGQEYENSDTKLPIADHIDLSEDKSTGERQIVFKHKNKKPTKNDFVKPDALIDNKLTESIKSAISAYIVDAKVNVLKINTNSKVDIETIKLNKGVLQKVVKSPLAMFADNSATDILATKAPNGEWIFHEQATFNLDYGLQMGDSIVDNSDFDAAMNAEADIKAIEESSEYKEGEDEWLREKHDAPLRLDPGAAINIIEDIERRRQEELDKTNAQLEKIEKNGDSFIRAKIEVYTTLSNEETLDEVEIITFKDGSRRIRITDSKTGELIFDEKIKKDNSTTNEKFIEESVGNLDNTLKKISEDNNPNKTVVDKINAKYDAELKALEQQTTTSNQSELEAKKADIEKRRQEELRKFGTSERETTKYSIKVLIDPEARVRGEKQSFVSRDLMELAFKNDLSNAGIQTLDTIIRRGGYSSKELAKLLKPEIDRINAKYDAELAALGRTTTQEANKEVQKADILQKKKERLANVKPMYHHTNVDTKDFNFNNFQRGNKQVSQFGDGLNASSNTTSFLVSRYGKPIQGEVNDADFVKINASKTEKEVYEELKKQGYIFSEIHDTNDVLSEVPGAAMELFTDFQKSNPNVKGVRVSNHIIGNTKVAPFYVIYDAKSFYGQGALSKKIEQESNAELAALNNLTNTDTSATEEKSKPVPDDDFSIATEDYESIIVDDDKNKALLDTYTIDYPGMTDSLKDDLVNDFAARIMTRFNGTAKSAPIKNIGDNLASVKKYYFEKYIPNQTNPILKDMPSYYNKLESLAFAKVQAMGLKITGKQVGNLAIDEMEALDFSGENGRAVERYDTSIFDIDDRDRASFRLKSKLALIRDGETQMGFDRYLDPENTYGLIRQLLANKPYMTVGEAVKFLRKQKNQSRVLNLVADDIEKWDMSAKNEFRTVFNLHKNKTGIMLWNSKGGEYSANIIDADRVSGGRMMVSKWQSAFMDIVEDPNNNMVINSESEPYLINADKVNKIKEDYIELTNQYYEFEEVYGEVPNSAVYAEQIAGLLNQLGIDVVTDEIKSIIDYPYEYAKIAEGWERNNMSHVFNNKSGVIGVLFSNIGNIPSTKTELIGEDNYISMEKYNPFTEGGNYLSNLGKFISYKRGNIDSESAYSASGNIKFAYTIPNPLSNVVDRIKSGNYDIENASSFAQRSELVNDPSYDVELMDALKEETEGIFEESNKLKPAELESEELGGIQNNGNKRRFAQIPTNSDKSLFAKTSLSANRESNTFLEDQIANNSAYLVKSVEIESERMRQFNGLSTGIADSKTIDGLTGNTKYDNGYKYFYLLPTANIQIAKAKLKEQIVSLVDITALDDSTSFEAEIKNILPTYSERYFSGYDSDSEESFYKQFMNNQEEHAKVLNQPDLAHLIMMASGETNASATSWNMTIDEFIEKIIDNNYEKTNPIYLDNGKIKFDTAIPKNDFGFVSMLAANKFNEELKNKLDLWNKYDIGIKRMDSQWKAKVIGNGKNVFSEKLNALITFTDAQIVEIAAREMIYYSTFASLEYYQLVAGDPASFYKGPSNKLLSDSTSEEVNNFIHATNIDAVKRNAKNLAAGTLPSFDILRYDEKTDTFTPETQKTYHSAAISDNYRASINKDIMANERLAGMYGMDGKGRGKINVADALEYSSFEEHLHVMFAKGTQDLTMDMYKSMLPKARYQDRLKWNQKVPDQYKLTDEELKFVFGMMKPVQVSNVQFKSNGVGGANYATQVEVYIKSSSMPIIHQLFQGLEVAKLKQGMFYEGDVLRETPIDRLAYESAYKGGALRIANVWDAKGNITNIDALYPVELPREGFFIQQEIPYDELKNKILIMSQMDKLFTEGYAQHDKTDVLGRKAEVKKAMFREAKADFLKRFGAKLQEDGETYEFQDLNKVVELLKKEAFSRGFSKNVIDQLRIVDGKLDPMFFNTASQKYESVLASLVSGIILQKVHGHSYVQTSASGVITPDQIPDDFKRDIVTVPGHNMSMDLPFITKKDGKIEPAGVYVPFQFLSNKGKDGVQNKLNLNDYTITDETGTYLDMSKIDPSLLNLIGGRIPGQGPNSMLPIRILGFLPEYMGNTIVVPAEISVQMGSDFDVDKLYTYMWNYVVNSKTGQISKYDPNPKAIYKARKVLTDPFTPRINELKKRRTDELTRLVGEGVLEQVSAIKQLRQDTTDSIKEYEDAIQSYWGTEITADDQVEIDRNLYELKQLDQRVKDIDSDLKLIGEEKRKFANTTEGKAIQQELDQLYSELNEATKDFDPTSIVGQDIKSLQNQYFDLHWEVLTDENMFERIAESLDMNDLRLEFEKRTSKNEAAGLISPKFNRDTYLENRAGKQGVAIEANGIVMNAMIQNKGITLLQEGQDLSIKIKSKGKVLNLDILGNDARSQYDNEDRRIHKNLQNIQSESVDNAKNGRLGALNLNEDTFNAANALLMLSDSSKGGYQEGGTPGIGSVANDHVVALVEQDIIHEFIESKAASFNQFSKAKFSRYAEGKLKSSIIEKYYKLIHQKADEYIKIPSHMELIKNIVIPGVIELNSAKKLDLDSATPEQLDKYYRVQLNAFLGFLALDEVGQIVAGTQKAIDGSTKGIGKSFIESLMKERMFKDRIQDGNYESSYFGIKLNNVQSLEDSEYGVAMKEGVIFANNLFGKMFPYRNLFNKVTDYFKGQNKSLDEKDYRNIFNFYKTYIFANNDIYSSGDVVAERARLKEGDDNIFDRLKKYQAENTSGDYLLKGIVVEYDKINKERRLKYSAGKSQRQDEYLNTVSLLKMLNSNDEELRRFGNDLITYSFLTNPIQSANNFMMYIPASVQQSNVVSAYLNKATMDMMDDNIKYADFMEQFIRHNPSFAPKKVMRRSYTSTIELQNYNTYLDKILQLQSELKKPGLSDEEKTSIGNEIARNSAMKNAWFSSTSNPIYTELDEDREPNKFNYITFADPQNEVNGEFDTTMLFKTNKDPKTGQYVLSAIPLLGTYESRNMNSSTGFVDTSSVNAYELGNEEMANRLIPESETDLTDALENIKTYGNSNQTEIADILRQIVSPTAKISVDTEAKNTGRYITSEDKIVINPNLDNKFNSKSNREDIISGIIHESWHSVFNPIVARYMEDPNSVTEAQRISIKRLDILRKDALKAARKNNKKELTEFLGKYMNLLNQDEVKNANKILSLQDTINFVLESPNNKSINTTTSGITPQMKAKYYGLVNVQEFVTMAWSDNNFQTVLNEIKASKPEVKSFLERIVEAFEGLFRTILESFGITVNPNNVLAHTLAESYNVVSDNKEVELNKTSTIWASKTQDKVIYSGDAPGTDREFKKVGKQFGIRTVDYTPQTYDKLTPVQAEEVEQAYVRAVNYLGRQVISLDNEDKGKRYSAKLVRRDYLQAKAGDSVYAIIEGFETVFDKTKQGMKVIGQKAFKVIPKGGTAYAMIMADDMGKPVYAFDQSRQEWYKYTKGTITKIDIPVLSERFAGVGTKNINEAGQQAIVDLFENTYPELVNNKEPENNNSEPTIKDNPIIIDAKFPKDQIKANYADGIIGYGSHSTGKYASKFGGTRESFTSNEVIMISVNGNNRSNQKENVELTKRAIDKALNQGVKAFIADNETVANSSHNSGGEGEIRKYLLDKGLQYQEFNNVGLYTITSKSSTDKTSESIKTQASEIFNELEIKKCGPGGGLFKAADGMKPKGFTKGGTWKIVKDLKGYPTHAKGGVDLSIGKDGVTMHNGKTQIKAEYGLVIPKAEDGMIIPDGEDPTNPPKKKIPGLDRMVKDNTMISESTNIVRPVAEFNQTIKPKKDIIDNIKDKLDPRNIGLNDMSNEKDFNSAYAKSRKSGDKEFLYNGGRYNTNYKGTPEQQLKETGILDEQLGVNKVVRDKIYKNVTPYNSIMPPIMQGVKGLVTTDKNRDINVDNPLPITYKGKPEDFRKLPSEEQARYKEEAKPHFKRADDAWALYTGNPQRFNTFEVSNHKPSTSTDPKANYLSVSKSYPEIVDFVKKEGTTLKQGESKQVQEPSNLVFRNFKISKGKDEKGEYISYYDKWNLNPSLEFPIPEQGKPFEIYDRIYLNDSKKK